MPSLLLRSPLCLLAVLLLTATSPVAAQSQPVPPPITLGEPIPVMVLGSFHFAQTDTPDVLAPEHQATLEHITERLAAFAPTHVGLECKSHQQAVVDSIYAAYRAGEYELGKGERQQVGFRLAARLGHEQIYCVDAVHPPAPSFDAVESWDAFKAYGEDRGETEVLQRLRPQWDRRRSIQDSLHRTLPLDQLLDYYNTPEMSKDTAARMLLYEIGVGVEDSWVGADWVGRFQGRNYRMFAKIQKLLGLGDRLIYIVGNGHKPFLDDLFEASVEFESVAVPTLAAK